MVIAYYPPFRAGLTVGARIALDTVLYGLPAVSAGCAVTIRVVSFFTDTADINGTRQTVLVSITTHCAAFVGCYISTVGAQTT